MWCFGKSSIDFLRPYLFLSNSELGDIRLIRNIERFRIYNIKLEAMGGHGTTNKFIFCPFYALFASKCS